MNCIVCGRPIEEGRRRGEPPIDAKYCSKCRADRRRHTKLKYRWRPEFDAILKAQYYGGLNRRFQVLNRMIRLTGLPRWYIKRQAARLGLTMCMDRKPWTQAELNVLENLAGCLSAATISKRFSGSGKAGYATDFRTRTDTMGMEKTFTAFAKRTFSTFSEITPKKSTSAKSTKLGFWTWSCCEDGK